VVTSAAAAPPLRRRATPGAGRHPLEFPAVRTEAGKRITLPEPSIPPSQASEPNARDYPQTALQGPCLATFVITNLLFFLSLTFNSPPPKKKGQHCYRL